MVVVLSNSVRENGVGKISLVTVVNVKLINTKEEKVKASFNIHLVLCAPPSARTFTTSIGCALQPW